MGSSDRAGHRVAQTLAGLHPETRLTGLRMVGWADLQRAEHAQLQPQPVPRGESSDGGDPLDIVRHVRHQAPGLALARPVLGKEVVVREDQGALSVRPRVLADLPQALLPCFKGQ